MSSLSRIQLEKWLKDADVSGNVLDVGGSQLTIKGRTKSWNVKDYKILDLETPHECKNKPDLIMDLNKYYSFDHNSDIAVEKPFDIAFCLEVSEYFWNPVQAMKNIAILLKRGGLLYISFHFIYPQHNPMLADYLRYTPAGAEKILQEAGFEIENMKMRVMSDESNAYFYQFIAEEKMRPANKADHNITGMLIKAKKL